MSTNKKVPLFPESHIDLLTPSLLTEERLHTRLNVQSTWSRKSHLSTVVLEEGRYPLEERQQGPASAPYRKGGLVRRHFTLAQRGA